ncbi:unnamed protein product, partial [Rotaria sp. Silwood1]
MMNYYTPDEGYQALTVLGDEGRNAYRLATPADVVLPFLVFLSLSLPAVTLGKKCRYAISPFIYMISDYIENIAEIYVLGIYPKRNDSIMTLACYAVLLDIQPGQVISCRILPTTFYNRVYPIIQAVLI